MTSMPESLSNNALLSSEVRRVLAACSKKQVELDKVKADLARQQTELDIRKLEIKAKQNKVDKQQKDVHKFEKWFLQVDLIERIECIGVEAKFGPKSDTDSEAGTKEDSEGGSEAESEAEWLNSSPAYYDLRHDAPCEWEYGWENDAPCEWNELAASFQQARGDAEHSTHRPVTSAPDSADEYWDCLARSWGLDKAYQSANTTDIKNDSESPNNTQPTKTKSPIKVESPGKDTPTYKSSDHNDVGVSTIWNDPTVASRIPWSDPTAAPKLQQKDHNVQGTRNPSSLDRPGYPAVRKLSTFKKTLNWAKPVHNVDEWEQHNVGNSNIKPNDVSKGDKSDQSTDYPAYHWNDEWASTFVGTKVSDRQFEVNVSRTLRPRYNDRPRRPSSGLRHLDELTNKPANNSANSKQPENVGDWTVPSSDDELSDDELPNDKLTNVNEGKPNTEAVYEWSLSGHSSDADNFTTWEMPVVTPDSSKSGSGPRSHCSHISKGTSKKVKVEASAAEETYQNWDEGSYPQASFW